MNMRNILSEKRYFRMEIIIIVAFFLMSCNFAFSQEKENKKEIINPKRELFVVPEVNDNKTNKANTDTNTGASQTKPKTKSMTPELLEDPWEEKLQKRDSLIEAESKSKNQEIKTQEMKTDSNAEEKESIKNDKNSKM